MTTKHPTSSPPHGIIRNYHEEMKMLIGVLINTDEGEPDRNAARERKPNKDGKAISFLALSDLTIRIEE